jgi:hypothetical protein
MVSIRGTVVESPGARIIKLITAIIYGFRNKLECLSPASLFQPSLVLRDKHLSLLQKP